MRRTKIVATIGPSSEKEIVLKELIKSGVNVFRFNLKYGETSWHNSRIKTIRKLAKSLKTRVAILVDTPSRDTKIEIDDLDWLALSYLKDRDDIRTLRKKLRRDTVRLMAKVENSTAMKNLESIAVEADGLMVARGDLGRETPIEELALFQKEIINVSRKQAKPVIVATEMLYSMTKNTIPTRAEATDVANAVFDGADALMLSEETAIGEHPIETVKMMDKITSFCENSKTFTKEVDYDKDDLTNILVETANRMTQVNSANPAKSITVFTRSGKTVRLISRHRPVVPIVAISNSEMVLNSLCLSFGVLPFFKKFETKTYTNQSEIFEEIVKTGLAKKNETTVVIHGDDWFGNIPANRLSIKLL